MSIRYFTNVIKPTHLCNMKCSYCFNDDLRRSRMSLETLRRTIDETFSYVAETSPEKTIAWIWHGGEPTVMGIDFFRHAVERQHLCSEKAGIKFENSLQTNGVRLDEEWIAFLAEEGFNVSISIDGPGDLNDQSRLLNNGRGSAERVVDAIGSVKEAGLPLGLSVVLSQATVGRGAELYGFLVELDVPFNIIPLNKSGRARSGFRDVGISPDEYADIWIEMFDCWLFEKPGFVFCSDFVFKSRAIAARRPFDCTAMSSCSDVTISVDPEGLVYACASLSGTKSNSYGSLHEARLSTLLSTPVAFSYRRRAADPQCQSCKWQAVCHGGCQARAQKFHGDNNARDFYCPGLFRIYEHIALRLREQLGD